MEQKVSEEDFSCLSKIAGLQSALAFSCTNPVTIRVRQRFEGMVFSPIMYYDCVDDEELGKMIVERRVELGEDDIREHFDFHRSAFLDFCYLDALIVANDRIEFAKCCEELCDKTRAYLKLVEDHRARLKRLGFLVCPVCLPGHYFHVWKGKFASELKFNKDRTNIGAERDLTEIKHELVYFKDSEDKIPYISMPFGEGSKSSGLYDSGFRQNLSITKNLLENVGLGVD